MISYSDRVVCRFIVCIVPQLNLPRLPCSHSASSSRSTRALRLRAEQVCWDLAYGEVHWLAACRRSLFGTLLFRPHLLQSHLLDTCAEMFFSNVPRNLPTCENLVYGELVILKPCRGTTCTTTPPLIVKQWGWT